MIFTINNDAAAVRISGTTTIIRRSRRRRRHGHIIDERVCTRVFVSACVFAGVRACASTIA